MPCFCALGCALKQEKSVTQLFVTFLKVQISFKNLLKCGTLTEKYAYFFMRQDKHNTAHVILLA